MSEEAAALQAGASAVEVSPPGPAPLAPGQRACQVCNVAVAPRPFFQRYRICETHMLASEVQFQGAPQRFCQQCARFHLLDEFEGSHRSCRASSARHAERRRQLRRANSAKRAGAKRAAAATEGVAAVPPPAVPPAKRACRTLPQPSPELACAELRCSGQSSGGATITPQASTGGAAMPAAAPQLELQGSAESTLDVFSLPPLPPLSLPPMPLPLPPMPAPAPAPAAPAPAAPSQPGMSVTAAAELLQRQLGLLQQEQAALQAAQERAAQQLLQLLPTTVSALSVVLSSAQSGEVGSSLLLPASPQPKDAPQCPTTGGSPGSTSGGTATAASSPPSTHTTATAGGAVLPPPRTDVGAMFQALAAQQQRDEEKLLQSFLAAPAAAPKATAPAAPAPAKPVPRSSPSAFRSLAPPPATDKPAAAAAAAPSQLLASMLSGATALAKAAQAPPATSGGGPAPDLVQATLLWARALAASAGVPA